MENDPSVEFDHFLAAKLGGMTVAEMHERMSNAEYVRWNTYYARQAQQAELEQARAR